VTRLGLLALAFAVFLALAGVSPARADDTLTGDWGGARSGLETRGLSLDLQATYTYQGVVRGGFDGPFFDLFSDEGDEGRTLSGNLALSLDTEKAGLWWGGALDAKLQGRTWRSVLQRAGTVASVNDDALYPNVVDRFDESALALTELVYTQAISETIWLYAGLLDGAQGDENELLGSAVSDSKFLNSAILYSLVENSTVPNVSLGAGIEFAPSDAISGSLSVFASEESAGGDPFAHSEGRTFSTEWTFAHALRGLGGAQTFGFLYGVDLERANLDASSTLILDSILLGQPTPTTSEDTWAFYYNAHQYLHGDESDGFGIALRFGLSNGDPNPVKWNLTLGLGGTGLLPGRDHDTWGIGGFYLAMSNLEFLQALDVNDELGAELFYNIALTPWLHVTLDAQVIDSALPRVDTTWMLAGRAHVNF